MRYALTHPLFKPIEVECDWQKYFKKRARILKPKVRTKGSIRRGRTYKTIKYMYVRPASMALATDWNIYGIKSIPCVHTVKLVGKDRAK